MSDRPVKVTRWVVNYTLRPLQGDVDYGLGHPFRYILLAMCDFEVSALSILLCGNTNAIICVHRNP